MRRPSKQTWLFFALLAALYWAALPLFQWLFPDDNGLGFSINVLAGLFPLATFSLAWIDCQRSGFSLLWPIVPAALYATTTTTLYNETADTFLLFYLVAATLGALIGTLIRRSRQRHANYN